MWSDDCVFKSDFFPSATQPFQPRFSSPFSPLHPCAGHVSFPRTTLIRPALLWNPGTSLLTWACTPPPLPFLGRAWLAAPVIFSFFPLLFPLFFQKTLSERAHRKSKGPASLKTDVNSSPINEILFSFKHPMSCRERENKSFAASCPQTAGQTCLLPKTKRERANRSVSRDYVTHTHIETT